MTPTEGLLLIAGVVVLVIAAFALSGFKKTPQGKILVVADSRARGSDTFRVVDHGYGYVKPFLETYCFLKKGDYRFEVKREGKTQTYRAKLAENEQARQIAAKAFFGWDEKRILSALRQAAEEAEGSVSECLLARFGMTAELQTGVC